MRASAASLGSARRTPQPAESNAQRGDTAARKAADDAVALP